MTFGKWDCKGLWCESLTPYRGSPDAVLVRVWLKTVAKEVPDELLPTLAGPTACFSSHNSVVKHMGCIQKSPGLIPCIACPRFSGGRATLGIFYLGTEKLPGSGHISHWVCMSVMQCKRIISNLAPCRVGGSSGMGHFLVRARPKSLEKLILQVVQTKRFVNVPNRPLKPNLWRCCVLRS